MRAILPSGPPAIEGRAVPPPAPEMPLRSCCKRRLPTVQPPFSGPTMFSFGALASVKKVSQNGEESLISRIGRGSTPGWCIGIISMLMPSCLRAFGSVRTRQKHMSAYCAPEVQIFWPLISQWSPLSSALVCRDARSEPEPGSE